MFPDNRKSSSLVAGPYVYPYNLTPPNRRTAYAIGGIALSDPSQGLGVQLWTATALPDSVVIEAPNLSEPIEILKEPDIVELTLAFDQNMNYTLAYVQYGMARMYWYDTFVGEYVVTEFPGATTPRVTLDDRRMTQSGSSDIVLAYVKNNNIYFRLQRERFITEHLLEENVNAQLIQMGMNIHNRLQFKYKPIRTA